MTDEWSGNSAYLYRSWSYLEKASHKISSEPREYLSNTPTANSSSPGCWNLSRLMPRSRTDAHPSTSVGNTTGLVIPETTIEPHSLGFIPSSIKMSPVSYQVTSPSFNDLRILVARLVKKELKSRNAAIQDGLLRPKHSISRAVMSMSPPRAAASLRYQRPSRSPSLRPHQLGCIARLANTQPPPKGKRKDPHTKASQRRSTIKPPPPSSPDLSLVTAKTFHKWYRDESARRSECRV